MIINKKKLENYRKLAYSRLGLALYLEEMLKNSPDAEVTIDKNMVTVPLEYEDELIEEVFVEISKESPSLIISSSQKQCYFNGTSDDKK